MKISKSGLLRNWRILFINLFIKCLKTLTNYKRKSFKPAASSVSVSPTSLLITDLDYSLNV